MSPARPLIALALALAGCDARHPASAGTAALAANLVRAGRVELSVPPALADRAARIATGWSPPTTVVAMAEAGDASAARVVVGSAAEPRIEALIDRLPFGLELGEGRLELFDERFASDEICLLLVWEDPDRPGLPLTLVVGEDERRLGARLAHLAPGSRPSLEVWERGELALEARLTARGVVRTGSVELHARYTEGKRGAGYRSSTVGSESGIRVRAGEEVTDDSVSAYLARVDATLARLRTWADVADAAPLGLVLDRYFGGRAGAGTRELARFRPVEGELVVRIGADDVGDGGRALAAGLLRTTFAAPGSEWMLDAAALDAADVFYARPLEEWCAHLESVGTWDVEALLASDALARSSPLAVRPLRALLFRALREAHDPAALLETVWRGTPDHSNWQALLDERLVAARAAHGAELEAERRARLAAAVSAGWNGVAVDAPITRGRQPLGSRGFAESVEAARVLGAEAVCLRAHFALAAGAVDGAPRAPRSELGTLGGDAAFFSALRQVRAAGLRVAVVPELLSSTSGSIDGERVLSSEAQWTAYFERHRAIVLHAALLAELGGAELLFVGAGMPQAARTRPGADVPENDWLRAAREAKVAGWVSVIEHARAAFGGALSYAAESPSRAEWIGFWPDLDLVGVGLFPDFAARGQVWPPSGERAAARMRQSLAHAVELARSEGRPLLLSSVGFRSVERAWQARSEPGGASSVDEQARLFAVLANAVAELTPNDGLLGVLVFGWSSDPDGLDERGYGVRGKPASEVVERLFAR